MSYIAYLYYNYWYILICCCFLLYFLHPNDSDMIFFYKNSMMWQLINVCKIWRLILVIWFSHVTAQSFFLLISLLLVSIQSLGSCLFVLTHPCFLHWYLNFDLKDDDLNRVPSVLCVCYKWVARHKLKVLCVFQQCLKAAVVKMASICNGPVDFEIWI